MNMERKEIVFELTKNIHNMNNGAYRFAKNAITKDGIHIESFKYLLSDDIPLEAINIALSGMENLGFFLAKLLVDNLDSIEVLNAFYEAEKSESLPDSKDMIADKAAEMVEIYNKKPKMFYQHFEMMMESGDNVSGCGYEYFVDVYVETMKIINADKTLLF